MGFLNVTFPTYCGLLANNFLAFAARFPFPGFVIFVLGVPNLPCNQTPKGLAPSFVTSHLDG